MEPKKKYTAPRLTVEAYETEVGYAASVFTNLSFWDISLMPDEQVENYTQHDTWTSEGGFWD